MEDRINNGNALVSVVIPTYKRPDSLGRAINSVLNQTLKEVEVIVVDDNNPNSEGRLLTEKVMKEFATNPRVQYIRHPYNKNGSAARNTGARFSKAPYVAFLDDDDEFLPEKLESQIGRLRQLDDSYGCCYSKYTVRTDDGKMHFGKECREGALFVEALCRELCTMAGSNLLIKKDAFEAVGGFDESFQRHQDVEFLTKILQKFKLAYDDNLGLIVYVHDHEKTLDYQQILDQYEENFTPFIEALDDTIKRRFFYQINIQRFWDFLRTKHDVCSAVKVLKDKKVPFHKAFAYSLRQTFNYLIR